MTNDKVHTPGCLWKTSMSIVNLVIQYLLCAIKKTVVMIVMPVKYGVKLTITVTKIQPPPPPPVHIFGVDSKRHMYSNFFFGSDFVIHE